MMLQPRQQAVRWWLRPPPYPLPDIGLKQWWSVVLAVVLGAGFAVSVVIKGYIYVNSLISPPPPSPSAQIGQVESDIEHGQQILEVLDKGVADASARLEKNAGRHQRS